MRQSRTRRRIAISAAVIAVVGGLSWFVETGAVMVWDGRYELTVHVACADAMPAAVSCEAFGREEDAVTALEYLLPPESRMWSTTIDPFRGEPLTVHIPVSGRESILSGRELRRTQFQAVLVIATMPGGKRVGKVVSIPDGRVSRDIYVSLP